MPTYGVTATGFVPKTAEVIRAGLQTDYQANLNNGLINFSESSVASREIETLTKLVIELWELAQYVNNASIPDYADGNNLDNANSLVNVARLEALKSTATVTLETTGASPVTVPIGSIVKQSSNNIQWLTTEEVEIPPTSTIDVNVESENYGAFSSPIASIDTIVTTIAGWDSVTNASEGELGRDEETDPEYRLRKDRALVISQGGTKEATRNYILENVAGVTFCNVDQNRTDATVDGMLPHSIKVTVVGGTTQEICNAILKCNGNGIDTNGDITGIGIDDVGNEETIKFYRAAVVDIYIIVNLTTNALYDSANDDAIKELMANYGETLTEGQDVLKWSLDTQIPTTIEGITAVDIRLGTSPAPSGTTNITIASDEKARILSSNVVVNS